MSEQIPYVAYESSLTRADQTNKRLWILCLVLAVMLVLTNLGWVIRESQYAVTESTVIQAEQEADGNSNNYIVGGDYGSETEGQNN